jgi:LacI family transcriptional regulator, repressor for deo operon, udp, cdd, tsx, nupC, and nupG
MDVTSGVVKEKGENEPSAVKTMEEFSAASGISRSTVSKFFRDPESVRPATRARIEEAINKLRYWPNLFAVNFNRKNPKIFGMIVPSLNDPFYAGLIERVDIRATQGGYWTIVLSSQGERAMEERAIKTIMSLRVAGAIVAPLGTSSDLALLKQLTEALPVILLDARVDIPTAFVGTDNFQSIALMVDYLHRSGEPPCFFDMPNVNQNAQDRRQSYMEAMIKAGSEPLVIRAPNDSWAFEAAGFEQGIRYFSRKALPSRTILCANDRTAFGVIAAANHCGIRVSRGGGPTDIRVAGHDDHPLSRFASPPLTTVAQDHAEIANLAVELLAAGRDKDMTKTAGDVRLLEAKLIMRESA